MFETGMLEDRRDGFGTRGIEGVREPARDSRHHPIGLVHILEQPPLVPVLVVAGLVANRDFDSQFPRGIQHSDQAKMAAQQVGVAHHRGVLGLAAVVPVPARMTNRKYLTIDPNLAWSMGEAESRRLASLSRKHQKADRVIGCDQQIVILLGFPARSCQRGDS